MPVMFQGGFRCFFPAAALWAVLSMLVWVAMLVGQVALPTALDPVSWHAHTFLFGYLGAVLAGFVLTAVPNWTGRTALTGAPLAGLFLAWLVARVAVACSALMPLWLVVVADLAAPLLLAGYITREVVAAGNWRNLMVAALLAAFMLANLIFHLDAARGEYAAQGMGLRLGLACAVTMIAVIGGRIIPAFTANWLKAQGQTTLPPPPMQRFDRLALLVLLVSLAAWLAAPYATMTTLLLLLAGLLHLARLARWRGRLTLSEPLMWALHVGYGFIPLGALALAAQIVWPDRIDAATAQHVWMAGAIGLMTLVVMSRAILGHSGQPLTGGFGTMAVFLGIILSVIARVLAGLAPDQAAVLHMVSGLIWLGAFGLFLMIYGPIATRQQTA